MTEVIFMVLLEIVVVLVPQVVIVVVEAVVVALLLIVVVVVKNSRHFDQFIKKMYVSYCRMTCVRWRLRYPYLVSEFFVFKLIFTHENDIYFK